MIRYYLDEEPIMADVGTWVLADPRHYEAVRGRLGELVCKPVDGFGGQGVSIGPEMSATEIAALERRGAEEPARWIAQEVVRFSTHPSLIGDRLRPRHVDLLRAERPRDHDPAGRADPGRPRGRRAAGQLLTGWRLQGHLAAHLIRRRSSLNRRSPPPSQLTRRDRLGARR